MKKTNKEQFGISLDSLLEKKDKIKNDIKNKYEQQSKETKNQKERQLIHDSLFQEKNNSINQEFHSILKDNNSKQKQ